MAASHGRGVLVGPLDTGGLAATGGAGDCGARVSLEGTVAEYGLAIKSAAGVAGAR